MAYAVITFDKPDSQAVRERWVAEHIAYLDGHKDKLLASGGMEAMRARSAVD